MAGIKGRSGHFAEDMVGRRFGYWLVLKRASNLVEGTRSSARWECLCDCGTIRLVRGYALRQGRTTSCGCKSAETQRANRAVKKRGKRR